MQDNILPGQSIVGTCPECGGSLLMPTVWMATVPPPITCNSCGAIFEKLPLMDRFKKVQKIKTITITTTNTDDLTQIKIDQDYQKFKPGPNKKKLILTIGLPGSGKTTWAEKFIKDNGYFIWRDECPARAAGFLDTHMTWFYNSNRDDLRFEIYKKYNIKGNQEKEITKIQEERVLKAFKYGRSVIISDTNLNEKTQNRWKQISNENDVDFEIKDFTNVDLDTCIENDLKRERSVGRDVIMNMHFKYIRPKLYKHDNKKVNKPLAYIFDIDGTLALMNGKRSPYQWDKVELDDVNGEVLRMLNLLGSGQTFKIIILSGRDGVCKSQTTNWLAAHNISYDALFMRQENDMRKDSIIKKEIFMEHINSEYNIMGVFDDREQVVNMWRDLGLTCFQVADGIF